MRSLSRSIVVNAPAATWAGTAGYQLTPTEGGTTVTETFDWAPALAPRILELLKVPGRNARSIDATLPRLTALAEAA